MIVEPSMFDASPALTLAATPRDRFNIQIVSLFDSGDYNSPGPAANFDPHRSYSWRFIDASNNVVTIMGTFDPAAFNIDATGFANEVAGHFSIASNDSGRTISIVYTPVPRIERRAFLDFSADSTNDFGDNSPLRRRLNKPWKWFT
jgi:hypothetical protein